MRYTDHMMEQLAIEIALRELRMPNRKTPRKQTNQAPRGKRRRR